MQEPRVRKVEPPAKDPRATEIEESAIAALRAGNRAEAKQLLGQLDQLGVARPELPTVGAEQIFAPLGPINYVLQPLDMCPGAPTVLAGSSFAGKSLVAQNMLLSIAGGVPVLESFEAAQGTALHVDYEQGPRLTYERYQRNAWHLGLGPSDLQDRLRVACLPGLYLDTPEGIDALKRAADGCRLVCIDSLRACCPSIDENSSEVRRPLDSLTRLSEATGATFLVIHHARKPTKDSQGGAKASIRGSGAIFDACGSVIVLEAAKGELVRVSHEKARASGVLKDDFEILIEDVSDGRDPRRGLRVVAQAIKADSVDGPSEKINALRDRIRVLFKDQSEIRSKNVVAELLGARKGPVGAAIDLMLVDGELEEVGKTRDRRLRYVGTK